MSFLRSSFFSLHAPHSKSGFWGSSQDWDSPALCRRSDYCFFLCLAQCLGYAIVFPAMSGLFLSFSACLQQQEMSPLAFKLRQAKTMLQNATSTLCFTRNINQMGKLFKLSNSFARIGAFFPFNAFQLPRNHRMQYSSGNNNGSASCLVSDRDCAEPNMRLSDQNDNTIQ